ncbi:hypothetical protein ABNF97_01440 [Plantactinospora sp. B6F1]|uniref:hypothetical protein n=1 Tax=Plantactinospora sp. B6F1 TaxID=3158971 RepID=UPI00102D1BA4
MGTSVWRALERASPGPIGLAVWIAVTVPAPLLFFDATHRWEEDQRVSTALWWSLAALPALAGTVAARWTRRTGRQRSGSGLLVAVAVATLLSAAFLAVSMAVYRWVIPLAGTVDWWGVAVLGIALAAGGAAIGYPIGLGRTRRGRLSDRHGYLIGAAVAILGVLLAPVTIRLGAEGSTASFDPTAYGGVGPYADSAGEPGTLSLPASGRYAIFAVGFAPEDPDCRVTGAGLTGRSAELVAIPPGNYGGDAASYAWVASFDVPEPGTYALSCSASDPQASYTVGELPPIRGAVGGLIHWPSATIWLLGAVPGLLIVADAVRRRNRTAARGGGKRVHG